MNPARVFGGGFQDGTCLTNMFAGPPSAAPSGSNELTRIPNTGTSVPDKPTWKSKRNPLQAL
jgi:hypothetical protein